MQVQEAPPPTPEAELLGPGAAPGGVAAACLGVAVGLPFLATAGSVVWDADSSRLLASFVHVREHGPAFIVDTQDVALPYVLLGVPVAIGGIAAARIATLFFLV